MASRDDDMNWRPSIAHHRCQPQAVHRAWQVDIGENQPNIVPALQDRDCFVRAVDGHNIVACPLQVVTGHQIDKAVVLYD